MTNRIRVPLLGDEWAVYIIWGDVETVNQQLKRRGLPTLPEGEEAWDKLHGFCAIVEGTTPVICLPAAPTNDPRVIATIAHEACHAVNHVMRSIRVDTVDEEVFAHMVGAILRGAMKYAAKEK